MNIKHYLFSFLLLYLYNPVSAQLEPKKPQDVSVHIISDINFNPNLKVKLRTLELTKCISTLDGRLVCVGYDYQTSKEEEKQGVIFIFDKTRKELLASGRFDTVYKDVVEDNEGSLLAVGYHLSGNQDKTTDPILAHLIIDGVIIRNEPFSISDSKSDTGTGFYSSFEKITTLPNGAVVVLAQQNTEGSQYRLLRFIKNKNTLEAFSQEIKNVESIAALCPNLSVIEGDEFAVAWNKKNEHKAINLDTYNLINRLKNKSKSIKNENDKLPFHDVQLFQILDDGTFILAGTHFVTKSTSPTGWATIVNNLNAKIISRKFPKIGTEFSQPTAICPIDEQAYWVTISTKKISKVFLVPRTTNNNSLSAKKLPTKQILVKSILKDADTIYTAVCIDNAIDKKIRLTQFSYTSTEKNSNTPITAKNGRTDFVKIEDIKLQINGVKQTSLALNSKAYLNFKIKNNSGQTLPPGATCQVELVLGKKGLRLNIEQNNLIGSLQTNGFLHSSQFCRISVENTEGGYSEKNMLVLKVLRDGTVWAKEEFYFSAGSPPPSSIATIRLSSKGRWDNPIQTSTNNTTIMGRGYHSPSKDSIKIDHNSKYDESTKRFTSKLKPSKDSYKYETGEFDGSSFRFNYENFPLDTGLNEIIVSFLGQNDTTYIKYIAGQHNIHALIIGVPYTNDKVKWTAKDGRDIAQALKKLEGKGDISKVIIDTLCTDSSTTTAGKIREAFAKFSKRSKLLKDGTKPEKYIEIEDETFIFVSSHGLLRDDDGHFCIKPSDYQSEAEREYTVDYKEMFSTYIRPMNRKVLAFVDACHSGAGKANEKSVAKKMMEVEDIILKPSPEATQNGWSGKAQLAIFTSSSGDEFSYEVTNGENGIYTSVLLSFFENMQAADSSNDREISFDELNAFLKKQTEKKSSLQHPEAAIKNMNNNDILFKY